MRNKRLVRCFLIGLLLFGVLRVENLPAQPEEPPVVLSPDAKNKVQPNDAAQNDSLLQIVPTDTATTLVSHQFEGNLSEKYASDDALDYERGSNKNFPQNLKEWITGIVRKLLGYGDETDINKVTETLLDIVYAIIFLGGVYIVVRLTMNHKGHWFFEKADETVPIDLSNVEQHIHQADFQSLLKEAEQVGDTRQSIRLLYLWTLKALAPNHPYVFHQRWGIYGST